MAEIGAIALGDKRKGWGKRKKIELKNDSQVFGLKHWLNGDAIFLMERLGRQTEKEYKETPTLSLHDFFRSLIQNFYQNLSWLTLFSLKGSLWNEENALKETWSIEKKNEIQID